MPPPPDSTRSGRLSWTWSSASVNRVSICRVDTAAASVRGDPDLILTSARVVREDDAAQFRRDRLDVFFNLDQSRCCWSTYGVLVTTCGVQRTESQPLSDLSRATGRRSTRASGLREKDGVAREISEAAQRTRRNHACGWNSEAPVHLGDQQEVNRSRRTSVHTLRSMDSSNYGCPSTLLFRGGAGTHTEPRSACSIHLQRTSMPRTRGDTRLELEKRASFGRQSWAAFPWTPPSWALRCGSNDAGTILNRFQRQRRFVCK